LEKIKTTQTLSLTPILKEALETSNRSYSTLSEIQKNEKIHQHNERWKTIKNEHDAFILEFTDNSAARFLQEQQHMIEGEYGEIFLTNTYGALVASTAKLTTGGTKGSGTMRHRQILPRLLSEKAGQILHSPRPVEGARDD